MAKLKYPKKLYTGIEVHCNLCKDSNPSCTHYDRHVFRVRVYLAGKRVRIKHLKSRDYHEAVREALQFRDYLTQEHSEDQIAKIEQIDLFLPEAIVKFNQFLSGRHPLPQHRKNVSPGHKNRYVGYVKMFALVMKSNGKNISKLKVTEINKKDVAIFYAYCEKKYPVSRTFNTVMTGLRSFFNFLKVVEDIEDIRNPFVSIVPKYVYPVPIDTLTKKEFQQVLDAVEYSDPYEKLGGKGETKNHYRPYLINGFKLALMTGLRREEFVDLKWSDIHITINNAKFMIVTNLKVTRTEKNVRPKYVPLNQDLEQLLNELGYEEKKRTNEFILFPERDVSTVTIMNCLSKGFSHYKKKAGIIKNVSLKNLSKTYITWVRVVLGDQTSLVTSHSGEKILQDHYLDSTILSTIEKAVLKIKVFGKNDLTPIPYSNPTKKAVTPVTASKSSSERGTRILDLSIMSAAL